MARTCFGVRPNLPPKAVALLRQSLLSGRTRLKADSQLIFVCGKQTCSAPPPARQRLLDHANRNLPAFRFFKAEDAIEALVQRTPGDLLSLEANLAKYADCIIIILESPGAIAELGAFAPDDSLAKIILAVNDRSFHDHPSFINEGPLAKIAKVSKFGRPILGRFDSILASSPIIEDRLKVIQKKRARPVDFSSYSEFELRPPKERMLLLADLLSFLSPLAYPELISLFQAIYGYASFEIQMELAMLKAIGLIDKIDGHYVRTPQDLGLFFSFPDVDPVRLRAITIGHYHRYFPGLLNELTNRLLSAK
jgi:hypothetical protein